eukprot:TRINITY_DN111633_c0_g1_i1.p1 TRINITY_DN111633_c0_g1~~TRINITY_DN111633_c0_g1_i1.p1  ORF type:complete len:320 (+),score=86.59 TRINITY_DN111633_c0_g1_i1:120-1079(+)
MGADAVTTVLSKRTAKTRRGKKILRLREPQIVEESKTALIIRGSKTSNDMTFFLRDLYAIRQPLATLYMRKHEEHPFEDCKRLEELCKKHDHTLFAFGSTSKKRPRRLILGRLFDGNLLDMQEFNIEELKSMQSFHPSAKEAAVGSKPLVIFQGSAFETDERMKRAKSLLLDFFGGVKADKVLLAGMDSAVVCTALDGAGGSSGKVVVRRYRLRMDKSGSRLPRVEMEEVGPSFNMLLDRTRDPDKDRWKMAIKVPKAAKPKKEKNIKHDSMGKKIGRFHLGKQDFDQIHTVHHGASKKKKLRASLSGPDAKKQKSASA